MGRGWRGWHGRVGCRGWLLCVRRGADVMNERAVSNVWVGAAGGGCAAPAGMQQRGDGDETMRREGLCWGVIAVFPARSSAGGAAADGQGVGSPGGGWLLPCITRQWMGTAFVGDVAVGWEPSACGWWQCYVASPVSCWPWALLQGLSILSCCTQCCANQAGDAHGLRSHPAPDFSPLCLAGPPLAATASSSSSASPRADPQPLTALLAVGSPLAWRGSPRAFQAVIRSARLCYPLLWRGGGEQERDSAGVRRQWVSGGPASRRSLGAVTMLGLSSLSRWRGVAEMAQHGVRRDFWARFWVNHRDVGAGDAFRGGAGAWVLHF